MNLHEHFLPADLEKASKEYKCLKDCLKHVVTHVEDGNVEKAKHYTIDMLRSLQELSKLSDRRITLERHKHYLHHLPVATHMQIIRGVNHE